MRILIDGDPIVYRAGFSSQNDWKLIQWHDVVDVEDPEADVMHEAFFAYVWEMEEFIEDMNLHPDEVSRTTWVDPLSEAYCLQIVKDNLNNIVDAVQGYLAEEEGMANDVEVEVYLSGRTNFRDNVATIPGSIKKDGTVVQGYKANRADSRRPYWYQRIRDYMVEVWDAKIFEGIEADDALAIAQWNEDEYDPQTIIATIDKDLQNVPGWHYNVLKKKDKVVTTAKAREHFYRQLLTGDKTDNIPGCYRVGDKKAESTINEGMTEQEMYDAVLGVYEENVEKFPERHGKYAESQDARGALIENARLLWMLQYEDQAWTPPGEADESLTDLGYMDFEEEL